MPKFPCPVCGDPSAFPLWVDKQPPTGCPHDMAWGRGEEPTIKCLTDCGYQMRKAKQKAEFRRLAPDCFDENGNIKDGALGRVLEAYAKEHPDTALILG